MTSPDTSSNAVCSAVCLHDGDDVAVMVGEGHKGAACSVSLADGSMIELALTTDIPFGHKVALRSLAAAEAVKKYGVPIGRATEAIAAGSHVHIHNIAGLKTELSGGLNQ